MDRLIPQLHLHIYASPNQALSYVPPTTSSVALLTLAVSTGIQLVNFVTEERFGLVDIDQRVLQGKISKATITTKHGTFLPSPKIRR